MSTLFLFFFSKVGAGAGQPGPHPPPRRRGGEDGAARVQEEVGRVARGVDGVLGRYGVLVDIIVLKRL